MSMQVLSGSVAHMMENAVEDDEIVIGSIQNKNILRPLIEFIKKWNHMVDIMLARAYGKYSPENGKTIQEELLEILNWLTKWQHPHKAMVEEGERTEWNFFADETWNCMKMLIMSNVLVIQYHCIERKFIINPRSMLTDSCENHFGNVRQCQAGSRTAVTVQQWSTGDCNAILVEPANFATIGNHHNSKHQYTTKDINGGRLKRFPSKY
ncbi:hypothetical protein ACHAWF_013111 [Thalassiosira exigua]